MPPAAPWNETVHSELILAMHDELQPTTAQIDAFLEILKAKGYSFTPNAYRKHLKQLRTRLAAQAIEENSESADPSTPKAKGRKRKAAAPAADEGADQGEKGKAKKARAKPKPKSAKQVEDEEAEASGDKDDEA